jgi:hypothetical protein
MAQKPGRRPAENADRHHSDEDHAGIDVLLGDVQNKPDADQRADELGRHERRPGGLQREPQSGEDHRQGGGQDDLLHEAPARRAEHGCGLQNRAVDGANPRKGVDDRRHEGGEPDDHDLRGVTEPEPQDRERDPGQRRDRANEEEDRVHQRFGAAAPAHPEAEGHSGPDRDEEAHDDERRAVPRVAEQGRPGVAFPADLEKGRPELSRRGKSAAADRPGKRGQQEPQRHERRHGRKADADSSTDVSLPRIAL